MVEYIIKRDNKMVSFDKDRIVNAIIAAMKEVTEIDYEYAVSIATKIKNCKGSKILSVEEVQDKVEEYLMKKYPKVARHYIQYRSERTRIRRQKSSLMRSVKEKIHCKDNQFSNANIDEESFSARKNEAAGVLTKELAVTEMLNPKVKQRWEANELYIHDMVQYIIGDHNCLNVDLKPLLLNGFYTHNGGVRGAKTLSTAMQLIAVIFQGQSNQQFGGVGTTHIDYDLAPFVRMSFLKHYEKGLKFTQNNASKNYDDFTRKYGKKVDFASITAPANIFKNYSKSAYEYALAMLEEEGKQSSEALYHNLNTLESRPGSQLPFTSINFGLNTTFEGRKITEWLLKASLAGVGKFKSTPIFPISIFQYSQSINGRPGTPNYDLFKLAIVSTTKRIYPNYVNADWSSNEHDTRPIQVVNKPSLDGNCKVYCVYRKLGENKNLEERTIKSLWDEFSKNHEVLNTKDKNIKQIELCFDDTDLLVEDKETIYGNYNIKLSEKISKVNHIAYDSKEKKYSITTESFTYCFTDAITGKLYSYTGTKPNYDYDTEMATMGCRTLIGKDRHGMGYKKSGRGNVCPITLNLTKLGIKHGICLGERKKPDLEAFWKDFYDLLTTAEISLLDRFNYISSQRPAAAEFMYENRIMNHSEESIKLDNVYPSMKHNTLGIGFGGLSNMLYALFGKYHNQDKKVNEFGLKLVKAMYDFAIKASDRNDLNFVVYASPIENSCFTMMKKLQKEYGKIKGVTDKDYINNSYHVPVYEKISIKDKIDIESEYSRYCKSGNIQYVEFDTGLTQNKEAVEDIIRYAMEGNDRHLAYFAINFPIDNCLDCGFSGEIPHSCPKCKSSNIQRLRRVTGYLTADYKTRFNKGKRQEVEDRVKHSKFTSIEDFMEK